MANVLFGADFHLDHRNIAKYRTQFRDEKDHFEAIEKAYHDRVTKRDKCYLLGDIAFSEESARKIAKWPGQKVLVAGNHCTEHVPMKILVDCFDEVHGFVKYKEFWLSHAPIHPMELRGKINIHGHVHSQTVNDCRYVNVSMENTDFKLWSLHEIRQIVQARKDCYENLYAHPIIQNTLKSMGVDQEMPDILNQSLILPVGLK